MEMNWIGPIAALSAFLGVWFGHVSVRKIESISPTIWVPTVVFASLGLALEWFSVSTSNLSLSAATGIVGITFLWDALEFTRQQNRIKKGHAPVNPSNPRHALLMQKYPSATALDPLKREPIGRPVSPAEAIQLVVKH